MRLLVEPREDDDLERALEILERGHAHRLLRLRDDRPEPGDDPSDDDPLPIEGLVLEIARVGGHVLPDRLRHVAQRVVGQVETQQLLLPREPAAERLLGHLRERPLQGGRGLAGHLEERRLAGEPVALGGLGRGDRVVEAREDLRRMAEGVECAHLRERLEDPLVAEPEIDASAEVGQ